METKGIISTGELSYNPVLTQIARQKILRKVTRLVERGDAVDQFKMMALYPIERAYDYYMQYVDLLNEKGLMRFGRKRFVKMMLKVFDDYQGRRDRLSHIPPEEFSDVVDLYDEAHGRLFETYRWQMDQSLLDSGITGWRSDALRLLYSCFCMLKVSIEARAVAKRYMTEALSIEDFKEFDFMDYMRALNALEGSLDIEVGKDLRILEVINLEKREQAVCDIVTSLLRKDKFEEVMRRLNEIRNERGREDKD